MDCAYKWLKYNWLSLRRHVDIEYVNDAVHRVAVRKVLVQEWSENVARVLKETNRNRSACTPLKQETQPPRLPDSDVFFYLKYIVNLAGAIRC